MYTLDIKQGVVSIRTRKYLRHLLAREVYTPRTRGTIARMPHEVEDVDPWPWVLTDPLDDALDYALGHRRRPTLFPPLLEPKGGKGGKRRREDEPAPALQPALQGPLVENEPGLCARMEATHAALLRAIGPGGVCCAAWRLDCSATANGATTEPEPAESTEPTAAAPLPPLAEPATAQRYARPLRRVEASMSAVLRPPMLYSLVHNTAAHEVTVEALGARWLLPPQSAFLLSDMARWRELPPLRPHGGYRLILADPPWHSASAQVHILWLGVLWLGVLWLDSLWLDALL